MCLVTFSKKEKCSATVKVDEFKGFPTWAFVHITNKCSHQCPWCYNSCNENRDTDMSISNFNTILTKLKAINIKQITLTGGEPTQCENLQSIVSLASDFRLHIVSNGDYISSSLARFLEENNVKQIQFSYQGSRFHDEIHGGGTHKKIVESIENVKNNTGIEIAISYAIGNYNEDYIEEVAFEAQELGADRLRFLNIYNQNDTDDLAPRTDITELFSRCSKIVAKLGYVHGMSLDPRYKDVDSFVRCPVDEKMLLIILTNGDIPYCCFRPTQKDIIISNIINDDDFMARYIDFKPMKFCGAA